MKIKEFLMLTLIFAFVLFSGIYPIFLRYVNFWCYAAVISLLTAIFGIYAYLTRDKNVEFTNVLRNFLKEPPGREYKKWYRYVAILIFLSIVFQISWIFDSVRDMGILLHQRGDPVIIRHHLYTFIFSSELLFILPLLYIRFIYKRPELPGDEKPLPRKALILGLSNPRGFHEPSNQIKNLEEKLIQLGNPYHPSEEEFKDLETNWVPPLRSILHEIDYLEEVYVLTSPQVEKHFEKFRDFLMRVPVIKERVEKGLLKLEKVPVIDISDFSSVKKTLEYLVPSKLSKYHDRDISFSLTGGTAISSAAMVLEAVHGDRQAEYIKQSENPDDRILVRIDVTEKDVPVGEKN